MTLLPTPHGLSPDTHPVDDVRRREFLAILAAAGLLSSCATDESGPSAPDAGYPRRIDTPEGATTLPRLPGRVAVTNGKRLLPFLEPFLAGFEINVVGYGVENEPELYPWIPAELFARPNSTDANGIDVERYASWTPEVILVNDNVGDLFEPLENLAPVVRVPEADWRPSMRILGRVFDDDATARRGVAETEAFIAANRRATPLDVAVVSEYQDDGTVGF